MPIEIFAMLERSAQQAEKRKAEAALKGIGGEPLAGSGFEAEESE
jgi:hypothetical protein